jgi:hypothetical protein
VIPVLSKPDRDRELLGTAAQNLFGLSYRSYFESSFVEPKQIGATYPRTRRRAGMQTQNIPTKASSTDQ